MPDGAALIATAERPSQHSLWVSLPSWATTNATEIDHSRRRRRRHTLANQTEIKQWRDTELKG